MNKKKRKARVLLRTEASAKIGMGHLVRCISLANMIKEDYDITFLLNDRFPQIDQLIKNEKFSSKYVSEVLSKSETSREGELYEEYDIVVLDGYNFKKEIQQEIKNKGKSLVFIDDLHDQHFYADAVINVSDAVTEKQYSSEPYTQFFLGSKYALLRKEFIEESIKPARRFLKVSGMFISMGGSDINNVSLKTIKAAQQITSINIIHVVIGAVNPHENELREYIKNSSSNQSIKLHKNIDAKQMCTVLNECELAVCPASGTCMEVAAVGAAMLIGHTANNQLGILQGLIEKDCAVSIGDFNTVSIDELSKSVQRFIDDIELVNNQINNQKKLVDGLSPQRINKLFSKLVNEN